VSYTYPGRDRPAVADADLRIGAGEIVALVGENGSGMTTLTKLIAALYLPTEGTTQWDRIDARELEPADVRRSVAVIFQDFVRYQLTALESIGSASRSRPTTSPLRGRPRRGPGRRASSRDCRRDTGPCCPGSTPTGATSPSGSGNGWRWRGPFVAMPRS